MAEEMDDCEFWLPPQFLTDEDFLMDFKDCRNEGSKTSVRDFPQDFSYGLASFGPNSGLSSPGESVVGSTETESDEDDYITGLTRKMAHSTLEETAYTNRSSKVLGLSGSPKSPLCSGFVGLGSSHVSSRNSSRYASQVYSPSGLKVKQDEEAWNLLCAAAGEVARMKMVEESTVFYSSNNGHLLPSQKPNPALEHSGPNFGFRPDPSQLSYLQLQATRFEQLKRLQMMKQRQQGCGAGGGVWGQGKSGCGHSYQMNLNHQQMTHNRGRNGAARPMGLPPSAWPTLQQSQQQQHPKPGSGMRAVFLGNSGAKRECAGTGVFLPRRIGSSPETRKNKPACSTVLLPDRVVHALNLNMETISPHPQPAVHPNPSFSADHDAGLKYSKNVLMMQQRQNSTRPPAAMNQELRLPSEWTY